MELTKNQILWVVQMKDYDLFNDNKNWYNTTCAYLTRKEARDKAKLLKLSHHTPTKVVKFAPSKVKVKKNNVVYKKVNQDEQIFNIFKAMGEVVQTLIK